MADITRCQKVVEDIAKEWQGKWLEKQQRRKYAMERNAALQLKKHNINNRKVKTG